MGTLVRSVMGKRSEEEIVASLGQQTGAPADVARDALRKTNGHGGKARGLLEDFAASGAAWDQWQISSGKRSEEEISDGARDSFISQGLLAKLLTAQTGQGDAVCEDPPDPAPAEWDYQIDLPHRTWAEGEQEGPLLELRTHTRGRMVSMLDLPQLLDMRLTSSGASDWVDQEGQMRICVPIDRVDVNPQRWSRFAWVGLDISADDFNRKLPNLHALQVDQIRFGWKFNQPLAPGSLPASLTHLEFGIYFDQKLDEMNVPAGLTHLKLGREFNQPLNKLPAGLTVLDLSEAHSFNQAVGSLPAGITELSLGLAFNQSLRNLPPHLTKLKVGGDPERPLWDSSFNQRVEGLPPRLTHLDLGGNAFNQPVNHLPASLKSLTLGERFNKPVDKLPAGLCELKILGTAHRGGSRGWGMCSFSQPLENLPENLSVTLPVYHSS